MKKILMMGDRPVECIPEINIEVDYLNPYTFFSNGRVTHDFLAMKNLDELWRAGDKELYSLLEATKQKCEEKDVFIANWVNPFPPEWVHRELKHLKKFFACMDDPHKAYERSINSLWAYDGAIYWTPDYDEYYSTDAILKLWGAKKTYWWPASWVRYPSGLKERAAASTKRNRGIVYVGSYYGEKLDRLVAFSKKFGCDFSVYGRWPLSGLIGYVAPIKNRSFFPRRVRSLSDSERSEIYVNTKIGFNMHLSALPREIGNMRMFETTLHGILLLSDKGCGDGYKKIFTPGKEAIFYDTLAQAVEFADFYLNNEKEREDIAMAGFERAWRDYDPEKVFHDLLLWTTMGDA